MAETAAQLPDEVLPERPLRQGVLSLPHALRFLLATDPDALTLVQRFGSALNLNAHFHIYVSRHPLASERFTLRQVRVGLRAVWEGADGERIEWGGCGRQKATSALSR